MKGPSRVLHGLVGSVKPINLKGRAISLDREGGNFVSKEKERGDGHGVVLSRSTIASAAVLALLYAWGADAVWLNMPATGTKCVSEEIQPNVVVQADYLVVHEDPSHGHPTIAVKVTSPYGNTLHHNENVTVGQFAFTTTESGNYLACFWMDSADNRVGVSVNLDWKIGIAAKDWDSVAKKEKIEGVELELRKLEAAVEVIHNNLYLKTREAEMREVSERTNARVAWFSLMSLVFASLSLFCSHGTCRGSFKRRNLFRRYV